MRIDSLLLHAWISLTVRRKRAWPDQKLGFPVGLGVPFRLRDLKRCEEGGFLEQLEIVDEHPLSCSTFFAVFDPP